MVSITSSTNISSTINNNLQANAASSARLSSGNKITTAADDVSGLAIGTALQTTVNALKGAAGNAAQGSSLLQVASGALDQQLDILQRQKALATQASSGSLTDSDRNALNQEFQGLSQQLDSLASGTNFNGVALLDGSSSQPGGALSFNVGTDSSDSINVALPSTSSTSLYNNQPVDISTAAGAQAASDQVDAAIAAITSAQAGVGALDAQFGTTSDDLTSAIQTEADASRQFLDTDIAAESTQLAATKLQAQASIATQAQANKLPAALLKLVS